MLRMTQRRADLADTMNLADHALQEVRHLALDLRPSILDDLGLTAALHGIWTDSLGARGSRCG